MGSFRPGAGNQHLHWYFNFTGCIVETVLKSLRLSCGSERTRQGISLRPRILTVLSFLFMRGTGFPPSDNLSLSGGTEFPPSRNSSLFKGTGFP